MKGWKKILIPVKNERAGVAILISTKTDFMPKILRNQRRPLYNDKEVNSPRKSNNRNYICI